MNRRANAEFWRSLFLVQAIVAALVLGMRAWVAWAGLSASLARADVYYFLYFAFEPIAAALMLAATVFAFLLHRRVSDATAMPRGPIWYWVAGAFAVLTWAGLVWVVCRYPLSRDEATLLFQAKIFGEGRVVAPVRADLIPALWPASPQFLVTHSAGGFWHSMYWPVYSLMLAPFGRLGAPEILNPLIGGATVIVALRYFRARGFGAAATMGAMSLLVCGTGFWCMSMTYYALPAHALLNLIFALLMLRGGAARAVGAGAVGSLALCLHQFVPHALFALPWWLSLVRAREWRRLALMAIGYAPMSLAFGVGWLVLSSGADQACVDKLSLGRMLSALASGSFDLGLEMPSASKLLLQALPVTQLILWSAPALPVLAVLGFRAGAWEGEDWRWACALALTMIFYAFVPYTPGHGWGYRYAYPVWMALIVVGSTVFRHDTGLKLLVPTLATGVIALALLLPYRAWQMGSFVRQRLAPLEVFRDWPGVVFVNPAGGWYHEDYIANDPFLRNRPLFLFSRGPEADAAAAASLGMAAKYFPEEKPAGDGR